MQNMPEIRMGIVAVSRDCFPIELARSRLSRVVEECRRLNLPVVPARTIVESERDALRAADEMRGKGVNAVAVYLSNFGPEGPTTIFAQRFGGPFMLCAAAEESKDLLVEGRGDAFCGLLSMSHNCGLRGLRPHIPDRPVGLPREIAEMVRHFLEVARVVVGVKHLKIFSFGPRPQDFYTCQAPLKPLYDLGVEVMENSELDLYRAYQAAAERKEEVASIARDMAAELGAGNRHPEKLESLARLELTLTEFMQQHLGSRRFGVFANKCWPAFEPTFRFAPCFVNSRLATRGIPVACEADIYGALSEYVLQLASCHPVTLLDINNTVPGDLDIADLRGAAREDLFMGFHCGNTPSCFLRPGYAMGYQLIMHRLMEPGRTPDVTCGTLEGALRPGPVTLFRIQGFGDGRLRSYVAQGQVLDAVPDSFGCIGVIAVPGFARFYRHVLLEKQFPHRAGVGFRHAGRVLFDALRLLGADVPDVPRPAGAPYPGENPF